MSAGLAAPQPPDHIAARLPSYELAEHALKTSIVNFPTGSTFFRAAWNAASVWPASVQRTQRREHQFRVRIAAAEGELIDGKNLAHGHLIVESHVPI